MLKNTGTTRGTETHDRISKPAGEELDKSFCPLAPYEYSNGLREGRIITGDSLTGECGLAKKERTMPKRTDAKRGLTLIELLVVLAIIPLLVTILVGAVRSAGTAERTTLCASNLDNIGKALYCYLEEFEGTFPVWEQWDIPDANGDLPDITWWYVDLAKTVGWDEIWTSFPIAPEDEYIWEDPGIFLCPQTDRTVISQGENAGSAGWRSNAGDPMWPSQARPAGSWFVEHLSYSWNAAFGHYTDGPAAKHNQYALYIMAGEVRNPHNKIVISDSDNECGRDSRITSRGADSWPDMQTQLGTRHNNGSNILFADGHVAWGDPYQMQCTQAIGSDFTSAYSMDGKEIIKKYWEPKAE